MTLLLLSAALAADRALIPIVTAAEYAQAAKSGSIAVKVELEVKRNGKTTNPKLDAPLYEGDELAFRFTPASEGWVYVLNRGTSGAYTLLYPASWDGEAHLPAGQPARVPSSGGFGVTGPTGEETVALLISPTSLGETALSRLRTMIDGDKDAPVFRALIPLSVAAAYATPPAGETELRAILSLKHLAGAAP